MLRDPSIKSTASRLVAAFSSQDLSAQLALAEQGDIGALERLAREADASWARIREMAEDRSWLANAIHQLKDQRVPHQPARLGGADLAAPGEVDALSGAAAERTAAWLDDLEATAGRLAHEARLDALARVADQGGPTSAKHQAQAQALVRTLEKLLERTTEPLAPEQLERLEGALDRLKRTNQELAPTFAIADKIRVPPEAVRWDPSHPRWKNDRERIAEDLAAASRGPRARPQAVFLDGSWMIAARGSVWKKLEQPLHPALGALLPRAQRELERTTLRLIDERDPRLLEIALRVSPSAAFVDSVLEAVLAAPEVHLGPDAPATRAQQLDLVEARLRRHFGGIGAEFWKLSIDDLRR